MLKVLCVEILFIFPWHSRNSKSAGRPFLINLETGIQTQINRWPQGVDGRIFGSGRKLRPTLHLSGPSSGNCFLATAPGDSDGTIPVQILTRRQDHHPIVPSTIPPTPETGARPSSTSRQSVRLAREYEQATFLFIPQYPSCPWTKARPVAPHDPGVGSRLPAFAVLRKCCIRDWCTLSGGSLRGFRTSGPS